RATELALVISLFVGGLKLRQPIGSPAWRGPLLLAGPVMLTTVGAIALIVHVLFERSPSDRLLLGAILAPTDPVRARAVLVSRARDDDRLRYGLSGEAGLNDGLAQPFVLLALLWRERSEPGPWTLSWFAQHVVWAVPVGLLIGFVFGKGI